MVAKAGEKANKTGRFHRAHCDAVVEVKQGDEIPECPNGHKSCECRTHEPRNKS
jgi:hypothetical protein